MAPEAEPLQSVAYIPGFASGDFLFLAFLRGLLGIMFFFSLAFLSKS